jgi:hypothetical protein
MFRDRGGKVIVRRDRQGVRPVRGEHLDPRYGNRQKLDVDTGSIHFLQAFGFDIEQLPSKTILVRPRRDR